MLDAGTAMIDDPTLSHLSAKELMPGIGVPIHVNQPRHVGDTPLHDHDFLEMVFVVEGRGIHRTIHGQKPISVGDVFILHPGQWHAYEQCRNLQIYNCCFGIGLLTRELAWARTDPLLAGMLPTRLPSAGSPGRPNGQGVISIRLSDERRQACIADLEAIRALQKDGDPVADRAALVGRLLLVLQQVARELGRETRTQPVEPDPSVATAVQALEERLAHDWSLEELATLLDLNRSYLVRLFKRHAGLSPMAWLARRRAEKAAVLLLTTNLPVAEIGRTVGWHDPNYFARRFRAAFGMTATAYRNQLPCPALVRTADDWIQW